MPIPVPPDITVKLYQLEDGGADLQKKVSPAEVSFSTGAVTTNDFNVKALTDLTESIEIDKGVYQIDGISLTVSGLVETFFNAYSDSLNEPYVCEIYDNNSAAVVFHGPIDRHSCYYNPGTGYTSFDVNSWLYVLEQTSAAARYIYDTKMTRRYDGHWDDASRAVFISKTINGLDMSTVVQTGDIVVFEAGSGEHRTPVISTAVDGTDLVLVIVSPPSNLYITNQTIPSGDVVTGFSQHGPRSYNYVRMTFTNASLWTALSRFHSDDSAPEFEGNRINIFAESNGGSTSGDVEFKWVSSDFLHVENDGGTYITEHFWKILDDGETIIISIEDVDQTWANDVAANGLDLDVGGVKGGTVDVGNKIRLLGREVYGYVETAGDDEVVAQMKVRKIVEGLFGLTDLGVMQYVTDTFTYPATWAPEWDKWLEYPNKLIDSLRQIQDTTNIFFKFSATLDGGSLPRMTLEVIPRTEANLADRGAATALLEIINYKEKAADVIPRAVRVEPSHKYFLPKAWNHVDHLGFYFSGMPTTAIAIASSIVPEGSDILKFKANWTPTYTDTKLWPTNGKSVMLDEIGKNIARRFFEFYESLNRKASFLYNGELDVSTVGNFVSINEGGLVRTIFVTKISRGIFSKESKIEGLVGEYTEATSSSPVAVIDGDLRYVDTDTSGAEAINLNGQRSYDPNGLPLTYEWILDPLGTPSTISTDAVLRNYAALVGTLTIRLEVDNGTSTDTADVTIKVIPVPTPGPGETDVDANFQQSPFLTLDSAGDVFLNAAGDNLTDPTSGGIVVDFSLTSSTGPWGAAAGTPFTSPISLGVVDTALAEDATIWVRVRLLNQIDGTTSVNEWIGQVTNVLGATIDSLVLATLLNLDGSFDMDGGVADSFSLVINGNTYIEMDDAGNMDFSGGGSLMMTLDAGGISVTLPTGDIFEIDVNSIDQLLVDANGVTAKNDLISEDQANGQQLIVKSATVVKSAMVGATVTATNLIPAGATVIGVTVRVTTLITGATSFDIGDGSDIDAWGATVAVALNTTTDGTDFTWTGPQAYASANSIVLTANGSSFTAGAVRITVHYIDFTPATS